VNVLIISVYKSNQGYTFIFCKYLFFYNVIIYYLINLTMYETYFRYAVIKYYNKFRSMSLNIVSNIEYIFGISNSTLYNWINLFEETGNLNPKYIGRPTNSGKINESIQKYIIKYFTNHKKNNIKNLRRSIKRIFNVTVKRSAVYYVLHKNKISFKKISVSRSPYSEEEIKEKKIKLHTDLNINDMISKILIMIMLSVLMNHL